MKKISPNSLKAKMRKIELFVFDVDGVLTDNTVYMGRNGAEYKRFCIADGMAVYIARRAGIPTAFISGRKSPATTARAKELRISDYYQYPGTKRKPFERLLKKYKLQPEQTAFMGDDIIDVVLMKMAGVSATVPHAPDYVKRYADVVTKKQAGFGAAREFVDMVLKAKGFDPLELTFK
ncbi:MAG: HAD hydrolase family protein [Candidatus Zixiibacteriota bacterium]|nr:MAG: HAD hydrolase family protein [candidate division Zixibacteria bacterium]